MENGWLGAHGGDIQRVGLRLNMCGIAGYYGNVEITDEAVSRTLRLMTNRGPDHQANCRIRAAGQTLHLLHSRLAIIDLEARSNQPFRIGDYTLIFNGEIYNYIELRRELEREGIEFFTSSDTEVLLRHFMLHGERALESLEGMFSFAIYNALNGQLFLARDRFGEKPLFIHRSSHGICFASEVKLLESLLGRRFKLNESQLLRYLTNGYRSLYKSKETFFEDVEEIPPASFMTVQRDGSIYRRRYWQLAPETDEQMGIEQAIAGVRERLLDSIQLRLRSDVPLAFCLSGGVDSAFLASAAVKTFSCDVTTFSILDRDSRYNEEAEIKEILSDLKCPHFLIRTSQEDFFPRLTRLIRYHDGPVSTISYYVHALLSEAIHEQGFKVAISGTGADEILTGYYDHFLLFLADIKSIAAHTAELEAWENHIKPLVRNPYLSDAGLFSRDPKFRGHIFLDQAIYESYLKKKFHEDFSEALFTETSHLKNRMMNELMHEIVPVILREDDLNSMLYSIENRSPYLDSRLVQFAYSIPVKHLMHNGYGKYVLREAAKGILNERTRCNRKKVGFNTSLHSLINFSDTSIRNTMLNESPIFELVSKEAISQLLDIKPFSDQLNKFMFNFINLKIFLEERS
ncbi:MAG: asparagine synthase (glutamine-hydrolyzing) [Deltaproteobacteria bacterium]|nr:asparagine synthase (glutamine-hydrolyzing) [Deltaproteobacteria bacterium]